ncbi:glycoside hydrolase family 30 beta sandwich domain-containing protein [Clostridium thermarum]|uniref:glycoside hydrolase family 30 beta sandwich domain-containing protein n=1 Tax=Clostridium thermarum TaxID=1716543 RepID=UPI0013CFC820|nr:glycoside hydrolase family 30 beta sandwich domain-containing protein [Clostridium thermarum]
MIKKKTATKLTKALALSTIIPLLALNQPIKTEAASETVQVWLSNPNTGVWLQRQADTRFAADSGINSYTITVDDSIKYQTMDGFGGSMTDASAWLMYYKLSSSKRAEVMNNLFGPNGINLSILRQPMGASDFSWEAWTYDDTTNNSDDWSLSNFSLWRENTYIRPMLDQAYNVNKGRIKIFATPWSPPAWMRSNRGLNGDGGYLRPEAYDTYADYFVKYIKAYAAMGTPVYAVTVQNEPMYAPAYPGMIMSTNDQIGFIKDYLGPRFAQNGISTKILAYDHNYNNLSFAQTVLSSGADQYLAGTAFHTYSEPSYQNLTTLKNLFPNKDVWITESGSGTWIGDNKAQFADQMMHMINAPRNWSKSVIFWNLALDQNAGPKLTGVDTSNSNRGFLTIRSDSTDSVTYNTCYYSMGHTSKFVSPGAYRISSNTFSGDIENVAYLNPDGTRVVILSNRTSNTRNIKIKWGSQSFTYSVPGNAALTFKWGQNSNGGNTSIVSIKSIANNKYVCAENGGASALIANRDSVGGSWEQFEMIDLGSGNVVFKSLANNKYVCADNEGASPLIANRDTIGTWETFQLVFNSDGTVGIKALANNKFVCADNGGADPLIANRDSVGGAWESFQIIK